MTRARESAAGRTAADPDPAHCTDEHSVSLYALGLLTADEAAVVESHMAGCPACASAFETLAIMPFYLDLVAETDLLGELDPLPARPVRRTKRAPGRPSPHLALRRRHVLAMSCLAALGLGAWAGTLVEGGTGNGAPGPTVWSAQDKLAGFQTSVTLTPASSRTHIQITVSGMPPGSYALIALCRDGNRYTVTSWTATGPETRQLTGAVPETLSQIVSFVVVETDSPGTPIGQVTIGPGATTAP